jgi:hypothetical protein
MQVKKFAPAVIVFGNGSYGVLRQREFLKMKHSGTG